MRIGRFPKGGNFITDGGAFNERPSASSSANQGRCRKRFWQLLPWLLTDGQVKLEGKESGLPPTSLSTLYAREARPPSHAR